MLLESDGLNERQLQTAGVVDWVLRILRECHSQADSGTDERVLALAASVACLVLPHSNPRSDSLACNPFLTDRDQTGYPLCLSGIATKF